MDCFTPQDAMQFSRNINESWMKWKQELDFYILVMESEEKPEWVKSSILLTCIRSKGREIYNTFNFENDEDKMTLSVIITKFDEYCTPSKNLTYLRHNSLYTYRQKEGQSLDDSVTLSKKLAWNCEFSTFKESLITDIIVVGILARKGCSDTQLTLERAISMREK